MNGYDGSWDPNFPPVMHFVDLENACAKPWKFIEAHPDYEAAKHNEDRIAAMRLVNDFLKLPENKAQLHILGQKYRGAILVSIHAIEANGKNQIPQMLADYIGKRTGLEVDDSIVQINRVHRTGTNEWHRFAFRPAYDGEVKTGNKYILVDDIFSLGGSFNELRRFIEFRGGKVVQMIALATGRSGHEISSRPETLKNLIDKYGPDTLSSFLKEINLYDGNVKALTEPEARALRRSPSLDEARNRILAARQEGRASLGAESPQQDGYQTPRIDPLELHHRRKLRW
jgi:predicted amidophosphoribosyltransferase